PPDPADARILLRNLWPDPPGRESRIVAGTRNRDTAARAPRSRVFAVVRVNEYRRARPFGARGQCAVDRQRARHRHRPVSVRLRDSLATLLDGRGLAIHYADAAIHLLCVRAS